MPTQPTITVYGAHWCPDCRRSKQFLGEHQIPYNWVDIEQDPVGEQYVLEINAGKRIIPTIEFADGSILVEPSNAELATRLGLKTTAERSHYDLIIGYSLAGAPRGPAAQLINGANAHSAPILSLDTPSGLDTSTGLVYEPAVRATATLTLALPKVGLRAPEAAEHVGELYLADIGVPPELYAGLGLQVGPVFAQSEIIRPHHHPAPAGPLSGDLRKIVRAGPRG